MDLYLVSTNPENTMLLSANGVAHYQISTTCSILGSRITKILRPAVASDDSIVAEIEWKNRTTPTILRSPLLGGAGQCIGTPGTGVRALNYLYKRHRFSPSRYFIGDDAHEYRWKIDRGVGNTLTRSDASVPIATSSWTTVAEGVFAGDKRQVLRIQPCSIDIDLIVLTFIIMETKRREQDGYADKYDATRDEEPQGDCGVDIGATGEL